MSNLESRFDVLNDCGENIRSHAIVQERYFLVKDKRNLARASERSVQPGENLKVAGEWDQVASLSHEILQNDSLDVEILAWLTEAWLRLDGYIGLRQAYELSCLVVQEHWDNLRSIDDDDANERFMPFAGLNGIGSDGTLIQPLRLASLIPGQRFGQHSLWDYQLAQRPNSEDKREELHQAATEAGTSAMSDQLEIIKQCLAAFDRLQSVLLDKCGSYAPPSSNIRNVLVEAISAVRGLGGHDIQTSPAPSDDVASIQHAGGIVVEPQSPIRNTGGFANRDEAFEALLTVARHFRTHEPHSPISLAIETLVRRGRMDFSELLAELLPEQQARNAVLTAAGINPSSTHHDK